MPGLVLTISTRPEQEDNAVPRNPELPVALVIHYPVGSQTRRVAYGLKPTLRPPYTSFAPIGSRTNFKQDRDELICLIEKVRYYVFDDETLDGVLNIAGAYKLVTLELKRYPSLKSEAFTQLYTIGEATLRSHTRDWNDK